MHDRRTGSAILLCLLGVFFVSGCASEQDLRTPNPRAIEEIQTGRRDTASAAWWGFNEADSTDAIQAAISSGAKKVVIPNMGKPWIVRPITLVSDQEITFEKGVEVLAKKGEFHGKKDSLFTAQKVKNVSLVGYGATLRMHKSDYATAPYVKAEWRMGVAILGSENISVRGLTIRDTGGDGVYIAQDGKTGPLSRNIHVKDVVCDNNYRQGISIISGYDVLVEDCVFRNTSGTPPCAGIDIEPSGVGHSLVNIVVRNCVSENNDGGGFFIYLNKLGRDDEKVSVLFDRCRSTGDRFGLIAGAVRDQGVQGSIEFRDCVVEASKASGVYVYDKSALGAAVQFTRCQVRNMAAAASEGTADPAEAKGQGGDFPPVSVPIMIYLRRPALTTQPGGVEFVDCRIEDAVQRPALIYMAKTGDYPASDIRGTLLVKNPHATAVQPASLAEHVAVKPLP